MKAPEKCLNCGSKYTGGSVLPGQEMKEGLRVFYECGSLSCSHPSEGVYQLLVKCWTERDEECV